MTETTSLQPTRAPDVDRVIHYQSFGAPHYRAAKCRMRAWVVEHLVVVTELGDNPGASVTNSIEAIAEVVDAQLGIDIGDDEGEWRLIEHYPANAVRGTTLDRVHLRRNYDRHAGRVTYSNPTWKRLPHGEAAWLYEALR